MDKLKPYSRNKVQILAFNRAFEGPPSEVISVTTPEGSKWRRRAAAEGLVTGEAQWLLWRTVMGRIFAVYVC